MKKQSSIEFIVDNLLLPEYEENPKWVINIIEQAKEMEKTEKAKNTLFVGKVVDEIGFDRTQELLIEVKNAFGS